MESSHKYTVAGHTFVITLPEGFRQETYLSPYSPFASEESSDEPLITVRENSIKWMFWEHGAESILLSWASLTLAFVKPEVN